MGWLVLMRLTGVFHADALNTKSFNLQQAQLPGKCRRERRGASRQAQFVRSGSSKGLDIKI